MLRLGGWFWSIKKNIGFFNFNTKIWAKKMHSTYTQSRHIHKYIQYTNICKFFNIQISSSGHSTISNSYTMCCVNFGNIQTLPPCHLVVQFLLFCMSFWHTSMISYNLQKFKYFLHCWSYVCQWTANILGKQVSKDLIFN